MRTANTRVVTGRVNADGTVARGEITAQKTAAGTYTIRFPGRLIGATGALATSGSSQIDTYTGDTCRLVAAADTAFTITATLAA